MKKEYKPFILWRLWFWLNVYMARRAGYDRMEGGPYAPNTVKWIESKGFTVVQADDERWPLETIYID